MKEIAELLKSLGPNYTLEWSMEYFGQEHVMIMTLVYWNTTIKMSFKQQHSIPFAQIENLDKYGKEILDGMSRGIQDELRKTWKEYL